MCAADRKAEELLAAAILEVGATSIGRKFILRAQD
jgi:hypothetical protein